MNSKTNHLPDPQLLERIEQYFDCTLTEEEERTLMAEIMATKDTSPEIESARAVMGFRSIHPNGDTNRVRAGYGYTWMRRLAAAAIAALIVTGGFFAYRSVNKGPDYQYIAYANGLSVTDEEDVMEIMRLNLIELDEGAEDIQNELIEDLDDLLLIETSK